MKYTFKFPVRAISKDNEKIYNRQGRFFLSKRFKDFEAELQALFLQQKPLNFEQLDGYLTVSLNITFTNKKHPDIGNLPKSILDAGNKLIWKDDRQIKSLTIDVNYGNEDNIVMEVIS